MAADDASQGEIKASKQQSHDAVKTNDVSRFNSPSSMTSCDGGKGLGYNYSCGSALVVSASARNSAGKQAETLSASSGAKTALPPVFMPGAQDVINALKKEGSTNASVASLQSLLSSQLSQSLIPLGMYLGGRQLLGQSAPYAGLIYPINGLLMLGGATPTATQVQHSLSAAQRLAYPSKVSSGSPKVPPPQTSVAVPPFSAACSTIRSSADMTSSLKPSSASTLIQSSALTLPCHSSPAGQPQSRAAVPQTKRLNSVKLENQINRIKQQQTSRLREQHSLRLPAPVMSQLRHDAARSSQTAIAAATNSTAPQAPVANGYDAPLELTVKKVLK